MWPLSQENSLAVKAPPSTSTVNCSTGTVASMSLVVNERYTVLMTFQTRKYQIMKTLSTRTTKCLYKQCSCRSICSRFPDARSHKEGKWLWKQCSRTRSEQRALGALANKGGGQWPLAPKLRGPWAGSKKRSLASARDQMLQKAMLPSNMVTGRRYSPWYLWLFPLLDNRIPVIQNQNMVLGNPRVDLAADNFCLTEVFCACWFVVCVTCSLVHCSSYCCSFASCWCCSFWLQSRTLPLPFSLMHVRFTKIVRSI